MEKLLVVISARSADLDCILKNIALEAKEKDQMQKRTTNTKSIMRKR